MQNSKSDSDTNSLKRKHKNEDNFPAAKRAKINGHSAFDNPTPTSSTSAVTKKFQSMLQVQDEQKSFESETKNNNNNCNKKCDSNSDSDSDSDAIAIANSNSNSISLKRKNRKFVIDDSSSDSDDDQNNNIDPNHNNQNNNQPNQTLGEDISSNSEDEEKETEAKNKLRVKNNDSDHSDEDSDLDLQDFVVPDDEQDDYSDEDGVPEDAMHRRLDRELDERRAAHIMNIRNYHIESEDDEEDDYYEAHNGGNTHHVVSDEDEDEDDHQNNHVPLQQQATGASVAPELLQFGTQDMFGNYEQANSNANSKSNSNSVLNSNSNSNSNSRSRFEQMNDQEDEDIYGNDNHNHNFGENEVSEEDEGEDDDEDEDEESIEDSDNGSDISSIDSLDAEIDKELFNDGLVDGFQYQNQNEFEAASYNPSLLAMIALFESGVDITDSRNNFFVNFPIFYKRFHRKAIKAWKTLSVLFPLGFILPKSDSRNKNKNKISKNDSLFDIYNPKQYDLQPKEKNLTTNPNERKFITCMNHKKYDQIPNLIMSGLYIDSIPYFFRSLNKYRNSMIKQWFSAIINSDLSRVQQLNQQFAIPIDSQIPRKLLPKLLHTQREHLEKATGLLIAAKCSTVGMVRFLVESGANLGYKTKFGKEDALMVACKNNNFEIVEYLCSCTEIDLNCTTTASEVYMNGCKSPAAFECISLQHIKCCQLLTYYGCDLLLGPRNSTNQTVSTIAYMLLENKFGLTEIKETLKQRFEIIKHEIAKQYSKNIDVRSNVAILICDFLNPLHKEYIQCLVDIFPDIDVQDSELII